MANQREPLALIEAKGRKHLTQAEKAERARSEVQAPVPAKAKVPGWLPQALRKDFRAIAKELIALKIYSDLDADTLGRYLMAHESWLSASTYAADALESGNAERAAEWGGIQDRYFKQASACARDLGLTVTSRCRLVVPEAPPAPESNPFLQLLGRREA